MFQTRLKDLRKELNRTQEQVAKSIGITRPAYTAYESGKRQPDFEMLSKLADYFNVSTDYLLGKSNNKSPSTNKKEMDFADDEVIKTFEGKPIPPEDLDVIKRLLRSARRDQ